MDIRDIKEEVQLIPGAELEEIFRLQKVILDEYIKIEGLPKYPIDPNTRESQKLIKDFISRIIEELGEAYESYDTMMEMFHEGQPDEALIPHLQNFNEEVADSLHFWAELLIYSNIEANYIRDKYNIKGGIIETILSNLSTTIEQELLGKKLPKRLVVKDEELSDEFLRGGRALGTERRDLMKQYLWDITYNFQIARNTLKNKPWKQSEMLTDIRRYEDLLCKASLMLFKFLSFTGFTPKSLFEIYYKKNKVNQFRIKSKY